MEFKLSLITFDLGDFIVFGILFSSLQYDLKYFYLSLIIQNDYFRRFRTKDLCLLYIVYLIQQLLNETPIETKIDIHSDIVMVLKYKINYLYSSKIIIFLKMKKHIQIYKLENEFEKSVSKYKSYLNTPSNQKHQKATFFIKNNLFTNTYLKNIISFGQIDKVNLYRNQSQFSSNRIPKVHHNNKFRKNNNNNKQNFSRQQPLNTSQKFADLTQNKDRMFNNIYQKVMNKEKAASKTNSIMYILSNTIAQGGRMSQMNSFNNKLNNKLKQLETLESFTF